MPIINYRLLVPHDKFLFITIEYLLMNDIVFCQSVVVCETDLVLLL